MGMIKGKWYIARKPSQETFMLFKFDREDDGRYHYEKLHHQENGEDRYHISDYCSVIHGYREATPSEVLEFYPEERLKSVFSL